MARNGRRYFSRERGARAACLTCSVVVMEMAMEGVESHAASALLLVPLLALRALSSTVAIASESPPAPSVPLVSSVT